MAQNNDGWVYLIEDVTADAVKIGRAKDPQARLANMRTGTINDLHLRHAIRCDMGAERVIHERFKDRRIRGEWFRDDEGLIAEMIYDDREFRTLVGREDGEPLTRGEVAFIAGTVGQCWTDEPRLEMQRKHLGSVVIPAPAS